MYKIFLIGSGGFLGAILRYLISGYVQKMAERVDFPYGTLAVNLIGCLLIGLLSRVDEIRSVLSTETRFFLFIGVLGAFTTFSTFSNETVALLNDKRFHLAVLNMGTHMVFGLAAVLLGRFTGYYIWR